MEQRQRIVLSSVRVHVAGQRPITAFEEFGPDETETARHVADGVNRLIAGR